MSTQPAHRTERSDIVASIDSTPLAQRAMIRKFGEWRFYLVGGGRIVELQGMHPVVSSGLMDHSKLFDRPIARGLETFKYAMRVTYGREEDVVSREIRELHRDIKGIDHHGNPYHAWNKEAWNWVHYTFIYAFLWGCQMVEGPLDAAEVNRFLAETNKFAALYSVREQDMLTTYADLEAYVERGVAEVLEATPSIRMGILKVIDPPCPRYIPQPLWRLLTAPTRAVATVLVFGSFSPQSRKRLDVVWTPRHQMGFKLLVVAAKAAGYLPEMLRMFPQAYWALLKSERHPKPTRLA